MNHWASQWPKSRLHTLLVAGYRQTATVRQVTVLTQWSSTAVGRVTVVNQLADL